ncbi:hypothetical protein MKX01_006061 [Papaver californicum]|nr:hypothetical protein MKX01_006061 [Papaver californicum]
MADSCAILLGRPLEGIYDLDKNYESDEEDSQSWASEIKVLIGDKIDEAYLSDVGMASPVNISPNILLNGEDIFMDAMSPSDQQDNVSIGNDLLIVIPESQPKIILGKRFLSDRSEDRDLFSPVFLSLRSRSIQDEVNQNPHFSPFRPEFNFAMADTHYSFNLVEIQEDGEFFIPS